VEWLKAEIGQQMVRYKADSGTQKVRDTAKLVRDFIGGFETEFEQVSLEERKVMIQKWIEDVRIDRDASKAQFKIRRIPALTPELAEALKSIENEGFIVSSDSAGTGHVVNAER
jgi:pyridoxal biosynthesis lyase PdxS